MLVRRFRHLDEEWEAESIGMGHGVGVGHLPEVTDWGVKFRCISNPSKGPHFGDVAKSDLNQVSEDDLKRALEHAVAKTRRKASEKA